VSGTPPEAIVLTPEEKAGIYLVGGETHPELSGQIALAMGVELGKVELRTHPNTEPYVRLGESVRNAHAIIMQPHAAANGLSVTDSWRQQLEMIDAARFADAETITAVSTSLAGARQDRPAKPRESVSIGITLDAMKRAGANRIVTVEAHSDQPLYGVRIPIVPLTARNVLVEAINEEIADFRDECLVIGPDHGSVKIMRDFGEELDLETKLVPKRRDSDDSSKVTHEKVQGVDGRTCVVVDDMIGTAGTIASIADELHEAGAKRIIVAATHPWFSGKAFELLSREQSPIDRIIVTNTLPTADAEHELGRDRLRTVSVAQMVAEALFRVVMHRSVSELPQGQGYK
jgi:ribose-phosphate pyrophosphokinase